MSNGVIFSLNTFFQGFIRHTPVLLFFYLHMKWNRIGKNAFVWPQSTIAHLGTFYSSRVKEVDTHRKKGLFLLLLVVDRSHMRVSIVWSFCWIVGRNVFDQSFIFQGGGGPCPGSNVFWGCFFVTTWQTCTRDWLCDCRNYIFPTPSSLIGPRGTTLIFHEIASNPGCPFFIFF